MSKQNYKRELKPQKSLGQHFLKDEAVSMDIAEILTDNELPILEIGPGTGALTKHLINLYGERVHVIEIDTRSVAFLKKNYPTLQGKIYEEDFLQINIPKLFPNGVNIIGNFPYNISSQIVFKVLENSDYIPQFGGMFQKEVAQRVCANSSNKQYGQLTLQREAKYDAQYLFDVDKMAFDPPPKVTSGVLIMHRNHKDLKNVTEQQFKQIVKSGFLMRRKKLRNSLKNFFTEEQLQDSIFDKRPEHLSFEEFVELAQKAKF